MAMNISPSGGVYVPPARLRQLQADALLADKSSETYQRAMWDALKKSIQGHVNKLNVGNVRHVAPELFSENLVRGRGLLCRALMKVQAASPIFTPTYACLVGIINSRIPLVGKLLLKRLIIQFAKAFRRNQKAVCISSTTFVAHLINQHVAHGILVGEVLLVLLKSPTDDSIEVAVALMKEAGSTLETEHPEIARIVFEQFRNILNEAPIEVRTQYVVETLFQLRKDAWKGHLPVDELDLVEDDDMITHDCHLPENISDLDPQEELNIFRLDPQFGEHESEYAELRREILGSGGSAEPNSDSDKLSESESDGEDENTGSPSVIQDESNINLINFRRIVYLTIKSAATAEECCHKILRVEFSGKEPELVSMIIESCSQETTYTPFYGVLAEKLVAVQQKWSQLFDEAFARYYNIIHRFQSARLLNIARLFAHLLSTDSIPLTTLSVVRLTEEDTTSSSRIFLKAHSRGA